MALIPVRDHDLTLFTLVDEEDKLRIGNHKLSVAGHGYVQISPCKGCPSVLLHRWIMGCKVRDGRIVDHINRDRLDNRRDNLRIVSPSESSSNVTGRAVSGFRGVYPQRSGRWQAKAKYKGVVYYLGTYDTPEEAAQVSQDWRSVNMLGYVP